jgi:hypothetical protein
LISLVLTYGFIMLLYSGIIRMISADLARFGFGMMK